MKVAIDVSQIAFEKTGVAVYVTSLTRELVKLGTPHDEFIIFGASIRKRSVFEKFFRTLRSKSRLRSVFLPIPPSILSILWNDFHIIPIEWLVGSVDIVWASDWTTPPLVHAKGITTIHDLSFLKYPETFEKIIPAVQKKRLVRAVREYSLFLCDSDATKNDVRERYPTVKNKLVTLYPGYSLHS